MQVEKLDLSSIPHGSNFLLLGARNSGKSVLLEDILYNRRGNVQFAAAQTSTTSTKEMLCKHIPPSLVAGDGFDCAKLQGFIDQMQAASEQHKSRRSVWIGDDLAFDTAFMKSKQIKFLAMNGRHVGCELYVTVQYLLNVVPAMRCNADVIMTLAEPIKSNRRKLHESFFSVFPTLAMFERVMDQVCANYGVLVLDRTQKSGKLEDMIKFYRASANLPPFRLGSPIYWVMHDYCDSEKMKKERANQTVTVT
jgi:hypothetical protein